MIHISVLVELTAIVALIVGVPLPLAGTVALLAATPATAVLIRRILKTDKTVSGVVDLAFLFCSWTSLPCLLVLHATDGVGENVFRLIVAVRVFAAVSIWRLYSQSMQTSRSHVNDEEERVSQDPYLERTADRKSITSKSGASE